MTAFFQKEVVVCPIDP